MSSKVKNDFSEAYFDMKSRFSPDLVMVIYGNAIYGKAIYGKAIYGKAIYGKAIYGKAIYGKAIYSNAIGRSRGAAAAIVALKKRPSKNQKITKSNNL